VNVRDEAVGGVKWEDYTGACYTWLNAWENARFFTFNLTIISITNATIEDAKHTRPRASQLPLEIICHVFKFANCYAHELRGVLATNRRFRELALHTPELWQYIHISRRREWMELYLSCAKDWPLLVPTDVDRTPSPMMATLQLMPPRVEHLDLTIPSPYYPRQLESVLAKHNMLLLWELVINCTMNMRDYGRS
jgi:hypothetical protein